MAKPDWLEELNDHLEKRGCSTRIEWDLFVLVEEDWACGSDTEDVSRRIDEGQHERVNAWRSQQAEVARIANS